MSDIKANAERAVEDLIFSRLFSPTIPPIRTENEIKIMARRGLDDYYKRKEEEDEAIRKQDSGEADGEKGKDSTAGRI